MSNEKYIKTLVFQFFCSFIDFDNFFAIYLHTEIFFETYDSMNLCRLMIVKCTDVSSKSNRGTYKQILH